jgi:ABC-2 type transport system permease protein
MNNHIPTLLQREWMQHKRGWLIAAFAPPLLFLAMLPFGQVNGLPVNKIGVGLIALAMVLVSTAAIYAISLVVALFQLPGLARRDTQDRSIEFWLSLPGRPSESVAATVLAHAWLAPLGAAIVGAAFGLPIAMSVLAVQGGMSLPMSVDWAEVVAAALPLLARGLLGTVPLLLWLLPLIFVLMAASAWLKRLGVPLVLVGTGVTVGVLHKVYAIDWPLNTLSALDDRIGHTLLHSPDSLKNALMSDNTSLWSWMAQDLGSTLAELVSLQFVGWMAVAAAGFALVVLKRSRGG